MNGERGRAPSLNLERQRYPIRYAGGMRRFTVSFGSLVGFAFACVGCADAGEAASEASTGTTDTADTTSLPTTGVVDATASTASATATSAEAESDSSSVSPQPGTSSEGGTAGSSDVTGPLAESTGNDVGTSSSETAPGEESTSNGAAAQDIFGITELYPSASGEALWTSEHWAEHGPYALSARRDAHDPRELSGMRGTGTLEITAEGELVMSGSQPRIYVYADAEHPWENVEVTVYYRRVEDAAAAYAGLVVGARSGAEGHGDDPCDAHTYYARLRHDGAADFAKELMHPSASVQSRVAPEEVWPGSGMLPYDTWIGWKFVVYDLPGGSVKLEAYRDLTEGRDGGTWELVNETVDAGGWFAETTCAEHEPVEGSSDLASTAGGTTFIRNTEITEARYRWFSIREITPP